MVDEVIVTARPWDGGVHLTGQAAFNFGQDFMNSQAYAGINFGQANNGIVQISGGVGPFSSPNALRREAENEWTKDPRKRLNFGRFIREKMGAKAGENGKLQDKVGMSDEKFGAVIGEAMKIASDDEIRSLKSFGTFGPSASDKAAVVNLLRRSGPDGPAAAAGVEAQLRGR